MCAHQLMCGMTMTMAMAWQRTPHGPAAVWCKQNSFSVCKLTMQLSAVRHAAVAGLAAVFFSSLVMIPYGFLVPILSVAGGGRSVEWRIATRPWQGTLQLASRTQSTPMALDSLAPHRNASPASS
jgi:hypothetical protein